MVLIEWRFSREILNDDVCVSVCFVSINGLIVCICGHFCMIMKVRFMCGARGLCDDWSMCFCLVLECQILMLGYVGCLIEGG